MAEKIDFAGPVYAGVIVLASVAMAQRLAATTEEIVIPEAHLDLVARDSTAGVRIAGDMITALRDSGALEGVHLIPVTRYREMAAHLEQLR